MIGHLVLMKLHSEADANIVTEQILSMRGKIPGLVDIQGGESVVTLPTTWHVGFVMFFSAPEIVTEYQTHEAHQAVGAVIRPLILEMATIDIPITAPATN